MLKVRGTRMFRLFRRRRPERLDTTSPAAVYAVQTGAYRRLCDQATASLDTRAVDDIVGPAARLPAVMAPAGRR